MVSIIVISYERPTHLRRTVTELLDRLSYPKSQLELILCDDCSSPETQRLARALPFDKFLIAERNGGLGRNTNKGIVASKGDYILQLQDDWSCIGRPDLIEAAVELFDERSDIGFIRLREPFNAPFDRWVTRSGRTVQVYRNNRRWRETCGEYVYTDNPHIKRRSVHDTIGLYLEGKPMHVTELDFCRRFEAQSTIKAAFIEGYSCFLHTGDDCSFNPLREPRRVRRALDSWPPSRMTIRYIRQLKRWLIAAVMDRLDK